MAAAGLGCSIKAIRLQGEGFVRNHFLIVIVVVVVLLDINVAGELAIEMVGINGGAVLRSRGHKRGCCC